MVAIASSYSSTSAYYTAASMASSAIATKSATPAATTTTSDPAATSITISDAARAAMAEKSFATIITETREKLTSLLAEADRKSPLEGEKLALDLTSLDARQLYAMSSDEAFTADEQKAAGLEMQRRFEAALKGPAALADVTGNYTGLYKAAGDYLDSLSAEEKAAPDWIAGRAAVTEGLKQLQANPKALPDAGADDPVALYLALAEAGNTTPDANIADVANSARKALDRLYADATKAGKAATFNKQTTVGTYIDLAKFDSRTLSSMVLDTSGKFTTQESSAAQSALRTKSGAALVAGFQNAAKSSDPTAFSQNIMSMFASMSAEERQAAGWSDNFYQAAVSSYQSTSKLMQMFNQATTTSSTSGGLLSFLGK